MFRFVYRLTCFFFLSLSFFSCQNKQTATDALTRESVLLSELSCYNQDAISRNPVTKVSWLRFCAVAGADCLAFYEGAKIGGEGGGHIGAAIGHPVEGAIIGGALVGTICGVGASYLAGKACCVVSGNTEDNQTERVGDISIDLLVESLYTSVVENYSIIDDIKLNQLEKLPIAVELNVPNHAIEMGAVHNEILATLNDNELVMTKRSAVESSNNLDFVENVVFTDETLLNQCKDYLSRYKATNELTLNASISDEVMQLYYQLINGSSYNSESLIDYINTYYSIVSKSSELSEQEKDCIYTGLSVSLFSYNYWKDYGLFD